MKNDNVLFSVIIPVYNVEKYLKKCVYSILDQRFDDHEIILVDDGSTDTSGRICDEFLDIDARIKVIHKKNGGLSSARNRGLEIARGEYIIFLDSDDHHSDDSLQHFYQIIKKWRPDVIAGYDFLFSSEWGIKKGQDFRRGIDHIVSGIEFYRRAMYQRNISAGAPYYVFRSSLVRDNDLFFAEGFLHEDELWTPILLFNAETVYDLKYRYYYHRCDNEDSITRSATKARKRALDRLEISKMLAKYFDGSCSEQTACFFDNISAQYMYAVYDGKLYTNEDVDRYFPFKYAQTFKYKIKAAIFMISPWIACSLRRFKQCRPRSR